MKVALVVLGLVCIIGAAYALPLDEGKAKPQEEFLPEVFSDFEQKLEAELSQISSTRPPRPPTRPPPRPTTTRTPRPPQIHDNDVDRQDPFSGRLVNVVNNDGGFQKTLQRNRIEFNFNSIRRAVGAFLKGENVQ